MTKLSSTWALITARQVPIACPCRVGSCGREVQSSTVLKSLTWQQVPCRCCGLHASRRMSCKSTAGSSTLHLGRYILHQRCHLEVEIPLAISMLSQGVVVAGLIVSRLDNQLLQQDLTGQRCLASSSQHARLACSCLTALGRTDAASCRCCRLLMPGLGALSACTSRSGG